MKHICSVAGRLALKLAVQFLFGGLLYYCIEVIFRLIRHHTPPLPHVFFLGGGAFVLGLLLCRIPLPLRLKIPVLPVLGCLILTAYEYLFGLYFLTVKNLRIWDYTGCKLEYRGLICLRFSLCWGGLLIVILGFDLLFEYLLRRTPFSYKNLLKSHKLKNDVT